MQFTVYNKQYTTVFWTNIFSSFAW